MTEIPEHLLKRAQAARDKAADDAATPAAAAGDSRIPDHLLERSKAARGDGGAVAVAEKASAVVTSVPSAGLPVGAGPGGHTQRLLTVVSLVPFKKQKQHQSTKFIHGHTCWLLNLLQALHVRRSCYFFLGS